MLPCKIEMIIDNCSDMQTDEDCPYLVRCYPGFKCNKQENTLCSFDGRYQLYSTCPLDKYTDDYDDTKDGVSRA